MTTSSDDILNRIADVTARLSYWFNIRLDRYRQTGKIDEEAEKKLLEVQADIEDIFGECYRNFDDLDFPIRNLTAWVNRHFLLPGWIAADYEPSTFIVEVDQVLGEAYGERWDALWRQARQRASGETSPATEE